MRWIFTDTIDVPMPRPVTTAEAQAFELAKRLKREGRIRESIDEHLRVLKIYPHVANAWLVLGRLYWEVDQYDEAVRAGQMAVQLRPKRELASLLLFHSLLSTGRVAEAIEEARRFLGQLEHGAPCEADTIAVYRMWTEEEDGDSLYAAYRKDRRSRRGQRR